MSFYGSLNVTEDSFIGLNCDNMLSIPEHRSGWNHVKDLCMRHLHKTGGYYFVDFVESIWGWKASSDPDALKDVYFANETHYVARDRVKFLRGTEYVRLGDRTVVYWNGIEWVESADVGPEEVDRASSFGIIQEPWVGVFHNPTKMPKWFDFVNSPQELVKNVDLQQSLQYCRGLIVFSEYLKQELLTLGGWPCEIHVVYHPTEPCDVKFNSRSLLLFSACVYRHNTRHKHRLVQVGYWLRRLSSIWEVGVPSGWTKHWINRADHGFRCLESELYSEHLVEKIIRNPDVKVHSLSDAEFDRFLSRSIMFIDLYDSSCNNTIIEAIVRHVPIVTRRLPATMEYLGKDYCLFFDTLDEIPEMLDDERIIMRAHAQLRALEQSGRYYADHFVTTMKELPFLKTPQITIKPEYYIALAPAFGWWIPEMAVGPFEYTRHDYPTVCRLIENNFDGFTDPYHLYINEDGYVAHREYNIVFSQETDTSEKVSLFARNGFEPLIRLYTKRIDNFHTAMTKRTTCLLYHNAYPIELVEIMNAKYPYHRVKVVVVNLIEPEDRYLDQPTNVDYEEFAFYTIKRTHDYINVMKEHLLKKKLKERLMLQ